MPGDDLVVVIDQNGVVEAETLDAACDLLNLLGRVSAGVARVRSQRVGGSVSKFMGGSKKGLGLGARTKRYRSPKRSLGKSTG
jgi:hypothetical protein